jgi:hypothetical protein
MSTHTFFRFTEQEHSGKPDRQRQVGIIENRTSGHGEVIFTLGTVELLVSLYPRNALAVASWTLNSIGPAELSQSFAAFFICIKQPLNV